MESIEQNPQPKSFEDIFAELNNDLGYEFVFLSDHNPDEGIYAFQFKDPDYDNQTALNMEKCEAYVDLLTNALQKHGKYFVKIETYPSIHIVVEKAD